MCKAWLSHEGEKERMKDGVTLACKILEQGALSESKKKIVENEI